MSHNQAHSLIGIPVLAIITSNVFNAEKVIDNLAVESSIRTMSYNKASSLIAKIQIVKFLYLPSDTSKSNC